MLRSLRNTVLVATLAFPAAVYAGTPDPAPTPAKTTVAKKKHKKKGHKKTAATPTTPSTPTPAPAK